MRPWTWRRPVRLRPLPCLNDGHPFPVPLCVYDETLRVLGSAVSRAKIGQSERLAAIRRLDTQARLLEKVATGPTFEEFIARERVASPQLGGRTVQSARNLLSR